MAKASHIKVDDPVEGGRQLVIGDVHGCFQTLASLIQKIQLTQQDQLFFLGDLINRGPASKMVLDHIIGLQQDGYQVFLLMGNHEHMVLKKAKRGAKPLREFLSYRNSTDLLNKRGFLRKRFKRLLSSAYRYIELSNFYLVHAGFDTQAEDPLAPNLNMLYMRRFWLRRKFRKKRVVVGHRPKQWKNIKRAVKEGKPSIAIDNGCVMGTARKAYGRMVCLDMTNMVLISQKSIDQNE